MIVRVAVCFVGVACAWPTIVELSNLQIQARSD